MSRLGVVKKVHRITLKTLNRVKHLKIHYQIKFHHILCNSLADMASLPIPNSLSLVLYARSRACDDSFNGRRSPIGMSSLLHALYFSPR